MAEKCTENAEDRTVSGCEVAAGYFEKIVGPQSVRATLKGAINSIVSEIRRSTGYQIKPSRVEDIWRGEARRIDWQEMDAIRATAAAKDKEARDARYRAEHAEVLERLAALEELVERRAAGRTSRPRDPEIQGLGLVERVLGREP